MKFVIRDDDLNFFSKPADIERWYADIFLEKIPVGFSTIPFVRPESDVYTQNEKFESREYAVSENRALIEYVRAHSQIEILQHGTTHETKDGNFEYAGRVPRKEALRGKIELEQAFGLPIKVFVPPHDWIGRSGIFSVEEAGLNVIRGRGAGLRNLIFRLAYLRVFCITAWFKLTHGVLGWVPAYPYVLDFGKHKEACSYRLEDLDVFKGLEYANRKNGIFVIVTHLHGLTKEKKLRLMQIIARAHELGAEFIRPSALFT